MQGCVLSVLRLLWLGVSYVTHQLAPLGLHLGKVR